MKHAIIPWVEKHRPRTLKNVVGQDSINDIQVLIQEKNQPHLIFEGTAGTGKTSSALAVVNETYKGLPMNVIRESFKELNASDARGINVIRTFVKDFMRSVKNPMVPFKILILDEADEMCLHPDTMVIRGFNTTKKLVKIKDLPVDKRFVIPSVNVKTGEVERDWGTLVDSGFADLYTMILEDGRKIITSLKHPFFQKLNRKFKETKLCDLEIGDKILCFGNDVGMIRCETCNEFTVKKRFCSVECKDKGHSIDMKGMGKPMYGKEAWNKGNTMEDDPRIALQARYGITHQKKEELLDCPEEIKITKIEYYGRSKVWNISVKKNQNFVLGNGILTHNTSPAQQALRRTMEKYTSNCRLILICNYSNKIIPPIQSRCAIVHFKPISSKDIERRIKQIARRENIKLTNLALEAISYTSRGDLRRSINTLQVSSMLSENNDHIITDKDVYEIVGMINREKISTLIHDAMGGSLQSALDQVEKMFDSGVSGKELALQIFMESKESDMNNREKIIIASLTSDAIYRISVGCSEILQIRGLVAGMSMNDIDGIIGRLRTHGGKE